MQSAAEHPTTAYFQHTILSKNVFQQLFRKQMIYWMCKVTYADLWAQNMTKMALCRQTLANTHAFIKLECKFI